MLCIIETFILAGSDEFFFLTFGFLDCTEQMSFIAVMMTLGFEINFVFAIFLTCCLRTNTATYFIETERLNVIIIYPFNLARKLMLMIPDLVNFIFFLLTTTYVLAYHSDIQRCRSPFPVMFTVIVINYVVSFALIFRSIHFIRVYLNSP